MRHLLDIGCLEWAGSRRPLSFDFNIRRDDCWGCIEKIGRALLTYGPGRTGRPRISLLYPAYTYVQLIRRRRLGTEVRKSRWWWRGALIVASVGIDLTQTPLFGNKEAADQRNRHSRQIPPEEFDITDIAKIWGC